MAEFEGVEGILGDETPEAQGTVAGADAVALALAMQEAGNNPALSRTAGDYLAEQRQLVRLQIKHFDEERRLGIAAAKRRRYADSPAFAALPRPDRADFESLYAFDDPDRHRALARALISIDIDPRVLVTWRAAAWASGDLGHDQAAVDFYRKALTGKKEDLPLSQRAAYPYLLAELRWRIDWALRDFATLDAESEVFSRSMVLGDR